MDINIMIRNFVESKISSDMQEIQFISRKYQCIQEILVGNTFQAGSYARQTHTKPVNDLDIINILSLNDLNDYENDLLEDIYKVLNNEANKTKIGYHHLKKQSRSIGIYFDIDESKFSIDIVPAIATDKRDRYNQVIFRIPETQKLSKAKRKEMEKLFSERGITPTWKLSTPRGYIIYAQEMDELTQKDFRLATRLIKTRRRSFKRVCMQSQLGEFPLKSFHLELIVADIILKLKKDSGYMGIYSIIETFFSTLPDYLNGDPYFLDLAYEEEPEKEYVDDYIIDIPSDFLQKLENEITKANFIVQAMDKMSNEEDIYNALDQIVRSTDIKKPIIGKVITSSASKPWCMN